MFAASVKWYAGSPETRLRWLTVPEKPGRSDEAVISVAKRSRSGARKVKGSDGLASTHATFGMFA